MHHYARAVAHATLEHETEAEQEKGKFYESLQRISPDRKFFNNTALAILGVGEAMMLGELEYHKGNYETAFRHLRESVRRCDQLHYSEPWPWMHPPRHALGALLLAQDQHAEAEAVYRADLGLSANVYRCAQHRENVWALHGLVECLRQRGESDDEQQSLEARLRLAIARTDVEISSSCCCRKMDG
jgi:tetratricopeptide (TPR) repeat protein